MFEVTFKLQDGGLQKTTKRFVLLGADYASAAGQAASIRAALTAVSGLSLVQQTLSEVTVYAYGANTLDRKERAQLTVMSDTGKRYPIAIPGPVNGIFAGAAGTELFDIIDTADLDLVAYINALQANAYWSDGEDLSAATLTIVAGKRG